MLHRTIKANPSIRPEVGEWGAFNALDACQYCCKKVMKEVLPGARTKGEGRLAVALKLDDNGTKNV